MILPSLAVEWLAELPPVTGHAKAEWRDHEECRRLAQLLVLMDIQPGIHRRRSRRDPNRAPTPPAARDSNSHSTAPPSILQRV
jgi:hypothetical protein